MKTDAENQRLTEKGDLEWVLSDPRGRRFVRRILEAAGMYQTSFAGEATHTMAFNEGRRNIGLFINDEILHIAPEQWLNVQKGK